MRKIFLLLISFCTFSFLHAQTDSLQQYTGKFIFPEGSPVLEIEVIIDNGLLTATSAMGNSELKNVGKDVFEIVSFGGVATFVRDSTQKITLLHIEVQDVIMDGTKEKTENSYTSSSLQFTQQFFYHREVCNNGKQY